MKDNLLNSAIISHEEGVKNAQPIEYGQGQSGTYVNEFGQTIVNESLPQLTETNIPKPKDSFKNEVKENLGTSIVQEPEITTPQTSVEESKTTPPAPKKDIKKYVLIGGIGAIVIVSLFLFRTNKN